MGSAEGWVRPKSASSSGQSIEGGGTASDDLVAYRDHPSLHRTLGPERFEAGLAKRCRREENALRALAEVRAKAKRLTPGRAQLREEWATMSLEAKRGLIASQIDCIFVFPATQPGRLWAIPSGEQPDGLPPRAPTLMTPLVRFQPGPEQDRVFPHGEATGWSRAGVTRGLRSFLIDRFEWPGFAEFQAAGLGLLHANAQAHMAISRWAAMLDVKPPVRFREMPAWSHERVGRELTAALSDWDRWPTRREFAEMGQGELRKAVTLYDGPHHWARRLGLPMSRQQLQNKQQWTEASMEGAVRELADGHGRWPTAKQFEAAGMTGLYETLNRAGVRRQMAARLGLEIPSGQRYRGATRWTDAGITAALDAFLVGRDYYPPAPAFEEAGLAGLFQKLGRQPGGHDAVATRYGLQRRGSGWRSVPN